MGIGIIQHFISIFLGNVHEHNDVMPSASEFVCVLWVVEDMQEKQCRTRKVLSKLEVEALATAYSSRLQDNTLDHTHAHTQPPIPSIPAT